MSLSPLRSVSVPTSPPTLSPSSSPVGKLLWEVGKALGKAVVAGIGLELARAASHRVKRAVGPKRADAGAVDEDGDNDRDGDHQDRRAAGKPRGATAAEVEQIRRENAALREELASLKRAIGQPAPDDAS
jgi:hypothetical protein